MKRALLVAAALHAGVFFWIHRARVPAEPTPALSPIEIEPFEEPPLASTEGPSVGAGASASPRAPSRGQGTARGAEATGERGGAEGSSVVVVGGDGIPRVTGDIHAFAGYAEAVESKPRESAPAPVDLSARARQDLREALYEHDKGLGLGAEGPIVSALESAAYGSLAPNNGSAVFEITLGKDGAIASIRASSPEWSEVADAARRAAKKARVPASANGVYIKIQLTSAIALPSGHSPSPKIDMGGIPLTKGGDDKSPRVSILNPIPKLGATTVDREGKTPIPTVQIDIFSTNIDPTDLTPRPRRVIAAKVLDEHLL